MTFPGFSGLVSSGLLAFSGCMALEHLLLWASSFLRLPSEEPDSSIEFVDERVRCVHGRTRMGSDAACVMI